MSTHHVEHDTPGAPDAVRGPSEAHKEAEARLLALSAEQREMPTLISEAEKADRAAVRDAVRLGEDPPKPTAPALVREELELERKVEAARSLEREARHAYFNAIRECQSDWISNLVDEHRDLTQRQSQAVEELVASRLGLGIAERLFDELQQFRTLDGKSDEVIARRNDRADLDLRQPDRLADRDRIALEAFLAAGRPDRGSLAELVAQLEIEGAAA